jgi:hypothetical protein
MEIARIAELRPRVKSTSLIFNPIVGLQICGLLRIQNFPQRREALDV